MVHFIETKDEFLQKISVNKLVVVDFTASWCGPCQHIAPFFAQLADKYKNVDFFKVDVDKNSEASEHAGIQCMPTFQFYKNGNKVDELQGASQQKLEDLVVQHQ